MQDNFSDRYGQWFNFKSKVKPLYQNLKLRTSNLSLEFLLKEFMRNLVRCCEKSVSVVQRFVKVQKGFNSDITVRGQKFHIQTEDWGLQNPFLVSRIFCNGAVMKTIKTPYETVLKMGSTQTEEAIKLALRRQHSMIIDTLMSGGNV